MTRKYPNFYITKLIIKRGPRRSTYKPPCQAKDCTLVATKTIEVQVSWFRGDDEYYKTCDEHAALTKTNPNKFWELMPEGKE